MSLRIELRIHRRNHADQAFRQLRVCILAGDFSGNHLAVCGSENAAIFSLPCVCLFETQSSCSYSEPNAWCALYSVGCWCMLANGVHGECCANGKRWRMSYPLPYAGVRGALVGVRSGRGMFAPVVPYARNQTRLVRYIRGASARRSSVCCVFAVYVRSVYSLCVFALCVTAHY